MVKESIFSLMEPTKSTRKGKNGSAIVIGSTPSGIWKNGELVRYSLSELRAGWEIHISV